MCFFCVHYNELVIKFVESWSREHIFMSNILYNINESIYGNTCLVCGELKKRKTVFLAADSWQHSLSLCLPLDVLTALSSGDVCWAILSYRSIPSRDSNHSSKRTKTRTVITVQLKLINYAAIERTGENIFSDTIAADVLFAFNLFIPLSSSISQRSIFFIFSILLFTLFFWRIRNCFTFVSSAWYKMNFCFKKVWSI